MNVLKCLIIFSANNRHNQQIDFSNDETAKEENLPPITEGQELPIVVIRTKENKKSMPGLNSLVNLIMDKFAQDLSTTIIYAEKDDLEEEDEGRKKKMVDRFLVDGIEDEFIIYCVNGSETYNYVLFFTGHFSCKKWICILISTKFLLTYFCLIQTEFIRFMKK